MAEKCVSQDFEIQIRDPNRKNVLEEETTPKAVGSKREITHPTSDMGALFHIIKSCLGAGILAMPLAYKSAGVLMGLFGCCFTGILVVHTSAILVNCSQALCLIFDKDCLSYADTAEYSFLHGFEGRFKKHAYKVRCLVNFFSFFTYYGVNIGYVLIMAETTKQMVNEYFHVEIDIRFYTLFMIFLVYPIGIVRILKFLVPFSIIANVLLVTSLCMVFRELITDLPPLSSRTIVQEPMKWPLFIATAFLCMEGIGTIMPVENEMRNPRRLTHSPGLLYIGITLVVILSTTLGFFGYLKYGDDAKASVSLNLPNDWLSASVKISIALGIWLTYGLQLTVSVKVVWDGVCSTFKEPSNKQYYFVRSIMILGTVIIATTLPSLSGIISLIGAVGFSMLGIFIPSLVDFFVESDNTGFLNWRYWKNIVLMIFAVVCAVIGTYCSIEEMLKPDED